MDTGHRILLVEDDQRLAQLIHDYLKMQEFDVRIESRGDTAEKIILEEQPDLVILDLMLPGKDGLAVCQSIRNQYQGSILMLTAREDDMDQVAGLEMGADDYVKKPIEPRVLLARIRALLRRVPTQPASREETNPSQPRDDLAFGALTISKASHRAVFHGEALDLTTNEFELLWYLAENQGQILSREVLFKAVRGIEYDGLDRSLDVMISRLRKKLDDDGSSPKRIKTIWGKGYLFVPDAF